MTNGIRVAKPGYSVESATPPQLVYSSEYATLRVEQQGSGTMTDSGGRTITIAHNLGYVPVFLCHGDILRGSGQLDYFPIPGGQGGNFATGDPGFNIRAWADSTNIYIKADDNFGYEFCYGDDAATQFPDGGGVYYGFAEFGDDNDFSSLANAAIKFDSINISQGTSVTSAVLSWKVGARNGTGDIYGGIYGLDQDATAGFSSGDDPFNRPETSATLNVHIGSGSQAGSTENWTVTSIVNEILARGGWSSGNDLGFKIWANRGGTSTDGDWTLATTAQSYLKVLASNTLLNYKYTIFKDRIS